MPAAPASCVDAPELWRIVIVDDSPDDRAEVRRLLLSASDRRFAFTEAATGASGIRAVQEGVTEQHCCVVLDYKLPDMTAPAFLAAIGGSDGTLRCPVVVFTGNDSAQARRSALQAGAHDVIGKDSMTPQGLLRAVENATERWAMVRDLRQQKAAVHASEQHYRALANATSDVTYRMSADWSLMRPLDGRELVASSDAPLGEWAWLHQNIPPDEHPRVRQAISDAIADKSLFTLEHRVHRPDGSIGWTLSRAVPILDANQGVVEWFGAASDITQRKAAEEALARSEQQFRTLADSIPQLCWMANSDGHIFWYNFGWYAYTGTTATDMEGWGWQSVHDPNVLPIVVERWQGSITRGEPFEMVFPLKGADGQFRQFLTRVLPVKDEQGAVTRWFGTNTDVTVVKEAEAALARRERELQTLADNTPDILTRFDRQLRHVFVNAAVERVTGRATTEFLGKTNRDMGMPIDLCDTWDAAIAAVFENGQVVSREFSYTTGTGIRHFNATLIPEHGPSGEVVNVLGVTRDRTVEKDAEDAMRIADRRKDEFLATLSHELRNPLAPIRSGISVLRMTSDPQHAEKTLGIIDRQLGQLVKLVDDLLDISRITSDKVVLRPERIELQSAIHTAIEAVRPLLDAAAQELRLELPLKPIWLEADVTRICQIVNNLLTNAVKYSSPGSSIALTVHRDSGDAVVTVADQGEGIPPNMLAHVFEMFTQINRTLDRAQGGLGIGLALVKRLVEMHGGTVSVESAGLGKGSTFSVRLPTTSDDEEMNIPVAPVQEASLKTKLRVLVVDDNVDAAEMLAELLSIYGHETRVANSGHLALAIVSEFRPALVFLDIGMPGMNGYETARRIRADDPSGSVTLVALTGWGAEAERIKAREAGFDHHFTKPVELDQVDSVLQLVALRLASESLIGGADRTATAVPAGALPPGR